MKHLFLVVVLFLFSSFASINSGKTEVLYKSEKGLLAVEKDFFKLDFDINYYRRGEGNHVEVLVTTDEKKYLGSVDESEYKMNKTGLIKKYNAELRKIFGEFDYSDRILRIEKRNRKCYFFYYDQLSYIQIGRLMSDGRYCVGAHDYKFQVREKRVIVSLYLDGQLKYGEKFSRDANYKIVERKDFMIEHLKTIVN
jgi:hypothetical protein